MVFALETRAAGGLVRILLLAAASAACATPAAAQPPDIYGETGAWTISYSTGSELAGDQPACAAVLDVSGTGAPVMLRVERVYDGYGFGIDGLSREELGLEYFLRFWFDDDPSTELEGNASFFTDPGYPDDDWLIFMETYEAGTPTIDMMRSDARTMIFAFLPPFAAEDDPEVSVEFDLTGAVTALALLDQCYLDAIGDEPAPAEDAAD